MTKKELRKEFDHWFNHGTKKEPRFAYASKAYQEVFDWFFSHITEARNDERKRILKNNPLAGIAKLIVEDERERFIHILKTTNYGPPYGDLSISSFIERVERSLTETKGEQE